MEAERRICELLDLDIAAIWQWSAGSPGCFELTHYYSAQDGPQPRCGSATPISPGGGSSCWTTASCPCPRWMTCRKRRPSTGRTAADSGSSRTCASRSRWAARPVGILGLNTTRAERRWPDAMVKRLQLVAQIFTNALARKRADHALRESELRLNLATDSADAGLWMLDWDTKEFWANEKGREIFGYHLEDPLTWTRFEASVHPRGSTPTSGRASPGRWTPAVRWTSNTASGGTMPLNVGSHRGAVPSSSRTESPSACLACRSTSPSAKRRGSEDPGQRSTTRRRVQPGRPRLLRSSTSAQDTCFIDERFQEICGIPAGRQSRPATTLRVLDGPGASRRPPNSCARARKLHDGTIDRRLDRIIATCIRPRGIKWLHHLVRRCRAGRRRARSSAPTA